MSPIRALLFFLGATLLLTWPLAVSPGSVATQRPDHHSRVWNAWLVQQVITGDAASLYETEALYHPRGISLAKHTLSLVNAVPTALLGMRMPLEDAARWIDVAHFVFSGFCFFLLARYLSGCVLGALLAGLLWSFAPYHLHYLPQVNLSTLEFLPLFALFLMRTWREGGWKNLLGAVLSAGLIAASAEYYLIYAALLGGGLVLGARLWDRETPWLLGVRRSLWVGVGSGLLVLAVAWPLVHEAFFGTASAVLIKSQRQTPSNDLLGFRWIAGPPQRYVVSWLTMLGYTSLALLLLGARRVLRQPFWLILAVLAFVMSLGPELLIAAENTGIAMPGALMRKIPGLSMLRKADRLMVLIQFSTCVLVAYAWADIASRLSSARARRIAGTLALVLMALELNGAPYSLRPQRHSTALAALAADEQVDSVVNLPVVSAGATAWWNSEQLLHRKNIVGGYVTNLAISREHKALDVRWKSAGRAFDSGAANQFRRVVAEQNVDAVILQKQVCELISQGLVDGKMFWAPYTFVARELMDQRLTSPLQLVDVPPALLAKRREQLSELYGEPILEDEYVAVFRTIRASAPRER